jgi:hypothetical protein
MRVFILVVVAHATNVAVLVAQVLVFGRVQPNRTGEEPGSPIRRARANLKPAATGDVRERWRTRVRERLARSDVAGRGMRVAAHDVPRSSRAWLKTARAPSPTRRSQSALRAILAALLLAALASAWAVLLALLWYSWHVSAGLGFGT